MSFPVTPLPALTELLIDGAWTPATVREESGVDITRGRANESSRVSPSQCRLTLDNRSADYSNRMPTSLYYGKLGRNTQLRHRLRWVQDTVIRTVSNGWGTADSLQVWSIVTGTASHFSTSGTSAWISLPAANVEHIIKLPVGHADMTAYASGVGTTTGTVPVGNDVRWALYGRYQGTNDFIGAELTYHSDDSVELKIYEFVGGVFTQFDTVTLAGLGSVTAWDVELRIRGNQVAARAWVTGTAQPAWMLTGTTTLTGTGDIAAASKRFTGNTTAITYLVSSIEVSDYRFWGEVPSWPQTWDTTGADVTAPIEAAGIMRRLGTRAKPLRSALHRTMLGTAANDVEPLAYWPCTDGSDATQIAAATEGTLSAKITGVPQLAFDSDCLGSEPLPRFPVGTSVRGKVPAYTDTGQWLWQFAMKIDVKPTVITDVAEVRSVGTGSGAVRFGVQVRPVGATTEIAFVAYDSSGGTLLTCFTVVGSPNNTSEADFYGNWFLYGGGCYFDPFFGAGTHVTAFGYSGNGFAGLSGGSVDPGDPGRPTDWQFLGAADVAIGHSGFYVDPNLDMVNDSLDNGAAIDGYSGELATDRMARLCIEERIPFEIVGDNADSAAMGPQTPGKLLDLMFECADADMGILYEPRDAFGLAYRTRPSLYNQTGLALDYAASQVHPPFAPTEDDQTVVNDATARRPDGSWARVVAEPGPLSTSDPPDGVGTYDEDRTYNVAADEQLLPIAGWRVHLGSWDEARYPQVHVMLHAPGFSANAALTAQAAAVDIGDYLSIDNPPAWLPPDLIELLAQGYRETHHTYEWDITWLGVPAGPYKVFTLNSSILGRLEGDHALASSVNTSATSWSVATLSGPLLATAGPFGQQWMVEGELVTVTNVTGGASPQTVTVTRNANGIPGGKAHGSGAACKLFPAPYLAL